MGKIRGRPYHRLKSVKIDSTAGAKSLELLSGIVGK